METMETVTVTLRMLMMAMQALMTLMQTLMALMQTFSIWKDMLYNILDDVAEVLEEAGSRGVSASEKRVLITKAVAEAWQATVQKTAATRPEAFGKLG